MDRLRRRDVLKGTGLVLVGTTAARAGILSGSLPWAPNAGSPPHPIEHSGWLFFNQAEALDVEAIADRLIPPDPETPGGKGAGCAVYVDRQLAGPYGRSEGLYLQPPFITGTKSQGDQSPLTPSELYRGALAALDRHCRSSAGGRAFHELASARQDEILQGLEGDHLKLEGADGKMFFEAILLDVQTGFFADPVYGGNRDMCAWKMIGFPGAHYDYREWVSRHNEPFPTPPVAITGRRAWTPR